MGDSNWLDEIVAKIKQREADMPPPCEHEYEGWVQDGQMGTTVCRKCGYRPGDDCCGEQPFHQRQICRNGSSINSSIRRGSAGETSILMKWPRYSQHHTQQASAATMMKPKTVPILAAGSTSGGGRCMEIPNG